jgi:pre-mRNA-splicing helicase BRR2
MNAQQIGEIVSFPKMGKIILNQIHKFPRLELEAYVQPVTRTLVRIELDLKSHESFTWDSRYHGTAEPFWIIVEDCDSENILHSE